MTGASRDCIQWGLHSSVSPWTVFSPLRCEACLPSLQVFSAYHALDWCIPAGRSAWVVPPTPTLPPSPVFFEESKEKHNVSVDGGSVDAMLTCH